MALINESRSCLVIFFSCTVRVPTRLIKVGKTGLKTARVVPRPRIQLSGASREDTTCENFSPLVFFALSKRGFRAICTSFSNEKPMSEVVGLLKEVIRVR